MLLADPIKDSEFDWQLTAIGRKRTVISAISGGYRTSALLLKADIGLELSLMAANDPKRTLAKVD